MDSISSLKMSMLWKGRKDGYFVSKKGLRQGDQKLSMVGRATLSKSILEAIPTYE